MMWPTTAALSSATSETSGSARARSKSTSFASSDRPKAATLMACTAPWSRSASARTLTVMRRDELHAQVYEQHADGAVQPRGDAPGAIEAHHPGGRPGDQQVPQRAVEIEDAAEKHERQRLARRCCIDELRQEGEEEQRHLGVEDVGEKSLQEDGSQCRRLHAFAALNRRACN